MRKRHYKILGGFIIFFLLLLLGCNYQIDSATEGKTHYNLNELPKNRVGIVLGTSSKLARGGANPDLIKGGIPEEKIFLDYAGFRTLDSMVRAKEVFGLDSVTVISQKFHNERAIYIAERKGLSAIGFNAKDVSTRNGLKVQFREYFARVKVFLDLLFNTQPKFYGDKVEII